MSHGQWSELEKAAASVLIANDTGGFVKPGPRQYPGQWNWDSALATVGLAHLDADRARHEVRSLLSGQWDDGMVPHIVFHTEIPEYFPGPEVWGTGDSSVTPTSGITQPPLLATAVRILNELHPSKDFLEEVVPPLELWHSWFQTRRLGGDGLIAILHPWESGMDNSPRFDAALAKVAPPATKFTRRDLVHVPPEHRPTGADYAAYVSILEKLRSARYRPSLDEAPFFVGDVLLTSVLIQAEADLGILCRDLDGSASEQQARSESLRTALERSWDPAQGLFLDEGGDTGSATVAGVLPLIAGIDRSQSDRLVEALLDPTRFGASEDAPWYATSVAKSDPRFEPCRYWRGPVWVNINWLLIRGLDQAGYAEEADRLRSHTLRLVSDHGFWEYYDPRTGEGLGCGTFSWTAAVVLDLLKRE